MPECWCSSLPPLLVRQRMSQVDIIVNMGKWPSQLFTNYTTRLCPCLYCTYVHPTLRHFEKASVQTNPNHTQVSAPLFWAACTVLTAPLFWAGCTVLTAPLFWAGCTVRCSLLPYHHHPHSFNLFLFVAWSLHKTWKIERFSISSKQLGFFQLAHPKGQ